jgi:hypothetical protein
MELLEALAAVSDPPSFLAFARLLLENRADHVRKQAASPTSPFSPGLSGWENTTIEAYLESAIAWAADSDFGQSQDLKTDNPWSKFANFLYCGKIYE